MSKDHLFQHARQTTKDLHPRAEKLLSTSQINILLNRILSMAGADNEQTEFVIQGISDQTYGVLFM